MLHGPFPYNRYQINEVPRKTSELVDIIQLFSGSLYLPIISFPPLPSISFSRTWFHFSNVWTSVVWIYWERSSTYHDISDICHRTATL